VGSVNREAFEEYPEVGFLRDELTGLPILNSVLEQVDFHLQRRDQVGFLYFDVVQFHLLKETYGREISEALLEESGQALARLRGRLFRDRDLVAVGGRGTDYFVIFLFSPPRHKASFSQSDLKMVSCRVVQKLTNLINEKAASLGVKEKIDFHSGYTVIVHDPETPVERLVYEAQKEAALQSDLDEVLVTFVSNLTHELRTPLTCIKGYAETLLEGALEDRDLARRWLQVISEEAERLERLINDLLDVSMMEAQQVEFHFEPTDLLLLAQRTAEVLMPHASKSGVTLAVRGTDALPLIQGDRDRLNQVLLNLVDNAVKYSPPGSEVILRLGLGAPGWVFLEVLDRGTGIPASQLPRIFERFYRIEKGRGARHGGRGLGLSIAKRIAEAHGGDLSVESQMGSGSVFRLDLPVRGPFIEEGRDEED
jgi:signal transduction histidine kinase